MKHIVFVEGLNSEEDANKIKAELDNTSVTYTISIPTGSVVVEGSNDLVHATKQAIILAGYKVK